jgi:hypothetical protein
MLLLTLLASLNVATPAVGPGTVVPVSVAFPSVDEDEDAEEEAPAPRRSPRKAEVDRGPSTAQRGAAAAATGALVAVPGVLSAVSALPCGMVCGVFGVGCCSLPLMTLTLVGASLLVPWISGLAVGARHLKTAWSLGAVSGLAAALVGAALAGGSLLGLVATLALLQGRGAFDNVSNARLVGAVTTALWGAAAVGLVSVLAGVASGAGYAVGEFALGSDKPRARRVQAEDADEEEEAPKRKVKAPRKDKRPTPKPAPRKVPREEVAPALKLPSEDPIIETTPTAPEADPVDETPTPAPPVEEAPPAPPAPAPAPPPPPPETPVY